MPSRRVLWVSAILAIVCGGLVWNVVFDLWLGQVERQYLWEQARYELGLGRRVSLKGMMDQAVREAAWTASAWALLVVAAIIGAGVYGYREGLRTRASPIDAARGSQRAANGETSSHSTGER